MPFLFTMKRIAHKIVYDTLSLIAIGVVMMTSMLYSPHQNI